MFDNKLLAALMAVAEAGSFERAARLLCLTPSAVSQRIRQLEERCGQTLLMRSSPVQLTPLGQRLLRHARQLEQLEAGLNEELREEGGIDWLPLPLALNNDSLSTWFMPAVAEHVKAHRQLLRLMVDDEAHTQARLRAGEVLGCISSEEKPPSGCRSERLGVIRYRYVASRAFAERYFSQGVSRSSLAQAPGLLFRRHDTQHLSTLERVFGIEAAELPLMMLPSTRALLDGVRAGLGYAVCPELQWESLLEGAAVKEEFLDILPAEALQTVLYWQCWSQLAPRVERFSEALVTGARQRLPQQ